MLSCRRGQGVVAGQSARAMGAGGSARCSKAWVLPTAALVAASHASSERRGQRHQGRQPDEGSPPAKMQDQALHQGGQEELPDRSACRDKAEGEAAPGRVDDTGYGAKDDHECRPRQAQTNQGAQGQVKAHGRIDLAGSDETRHIDHHARDRHPGGPVTVGPCAENGLGETEEEILQCDGEAERLAAQSQLERHRAKKKSEGLTGSHSEGHDERRTRDDGP